MLKARPRTAPARPIARIRRATVQRATRTPSPPQLLPDFPGAVDLLVLVIDPLNLDAELIVALRPCGPARRMCPLVPMAMIRRRGDRQHGADRLDPEHGAMVGDELDHRGYVLRRSSSAWAKYANAFRRIRCLEPRSISHR